MVRRFASTVFVCAIALGCNASISRANSGILYAHEGHNHTMPSGSEDMPMGGDDHMHTMMEIPPGQPVPTVSLMVHPDAYQGWNLELQTTNFRFAPESVNQSSVTTEGHAHLYIDGVRITRLYGNWYYLESLAPGNHTVEVNLSANGHETLAHDGQPIAATATIDVPIASNP